VGVTAANIHATVVLLEDRGVLIRGASGSGKTTLALALSAHLAGIGRFARFVGDDQVLLSPVNGRLLARAPEPIRGLVEVYGIGPCPIRHEDAGLVDLVVDLVKPDEALRYQEASEDTLQGCKLPRLFLPARNARACCTVILAWLRLPPFP
jgi:serine kinase of HPr protein (carbohydrate metabolism regulator)